MYTAQIINLKNHINQNNCTENQAKQTRVIFLNAYLQFKIYTTFALTDQKDCDKIYENLHSTAMRKYISGTNAAQSGLRLTFID